MYANVIHGRRRKRQKFEKLLEASVWRAFAYGIQLQIEDCIAFKLLHGAVLQMIYEFLKVEGPISVFNTRSPRQAWLE